ncbi:ATP-dependent DNA helicase [Candidatus Aerophobetes bacterium]|uniref:DNA 3'-5' helicase n=1 Tax=Aerophobetes bacterium TaxID=2030807 RepID=A0A2A4WYJ0_UNCAE|nr:MAG: ATP-dependent DNA helicase [Candidatus Aerophobetes bacterium]
MALNPQQKLAVSHVEGPMLVIAGAGSGKTKVVTSRICNLLNIGVPSSEIIALTFTNKAANEMRLRVQNQTNLQVWTSTFHALGVLILRESISHLGYDNSFTIYDAQDSLSLIQNCLVLLGQKKDRAIAKKCKMAISRSKNNLISAENFTPSSFEETEITGQVYSLYQKKLKEYGALDFDDLLYLPIALFKKEPEILASYQRRWRFLLIDEYQDTNKAQYQLIKCLAQTHQNIFTVGDPDQSIYSWRGADINNILSFEKDFPGAHVITLEENYRSTCHILNAAGGLITNNAQRYEKKLWSKQTGGEKVTIYYAQDERDEMRFIINTVMRCKENENLSFADMAIFYRTNAQSRLLEDAFLSQGIPYQIIGGVSFYERKEIKDLLAYVKVACFPSDAISFARVINLPKRGLGPSTCDKLYHAAAQSQMPILDFCIDLIHGNNSSVSLSKKQSAGVTEFVRILCLLQEKMKQNVAISDILKLAFDESGLTLSIKEDPETAQDRFANIDELLNKAISWEEERDETHSIYTFLEELSLNAQVKKEQQQALSMLTLHNSKGLEFPLCFVVGLEEDTLPHINCKDSVEGIEEERRLCYVGMTRAKRHLYLTSTSYKRIFGQSKFMTPSRFLSEIPEQYVQSNQSDFNDIEEDNEDAAIGKQVFHRDFGPGIIQRAYNTSLGLTYDIYFEDLQTTRSLVARYAKLQHGY